MPVIRVHGGNCCGIRHIMGFSPADTPAHIRSVINHGKRMQGVKNSLLLEIALTSEQLKYKNGLADILKEEGFRLVTKFRNPNSGNHVHVFHWTRAPLETGAPTKYTPIPVSSMFSLENISATFK